ncbi:GNAT family N-acetyltransferase [Exiguobacterium antarcticum]|uniref:GNAT family N-acetyltransferase n=1 Tax=Exiguobacterium antarcticum TaxID=132920 RepID=UPI000285F026|nr:GNAT family N-acetyltransferase [Exiguobacterium antarcticum]AFS70605.1 Acetyltransferase, GNAT family domain protein [Exiguobacterium antarcticum B7]
MIRQATVEDVPQIAVLLKEKAELLKERGSRQWSAYLEADLPALVQRDLAAGRLFVFEQETALMGSVALLPSLEWDQTLWDDREGLYIHRLVVRDAAKGRGVGKQLLRHVMAVATAEEERLRLDCLATNEFLNAYYASFGFTAKGIRDGFSTYEHEQLAVADERVI